MDKDVIYVFGHRHPDTDSVCASIAYADLKNKMGFNAEPRVLGDINKETLFILDYFKVPVPPLLETVKTQVCDLQIDRPEKLSPNTTIRKAWSIMEQSESKTLPVVDDGEKLLGIVSLSDITKKYIDVSNYNILRTCGTPLENITETLNAEIAVGGPEWFDTTGKVVVAAGTSEMLCEFAEKGDILVTSNREDIQISGIRQGVNCLILTCGAAPSETVISLAKENRTVVLLTAMDTFTTCRLINQSIPVGSIMHPNGGGNRIIQFREDDYVEDIKEQMIKNRYRSYPVIDGEGRVSGSISRYHLILQKKKRVILLDHNEKAQTCPGIEEAEVLEIIDHHKVGDLTTSAPILFKNEPVGSTATIIANLYTDMGRRPSVQIAGILCAAIISDTLKFESPTCTEADRRTADRLAAICGIDIEEFAEKMFTAGSELKGKTPKEIYSQDFKRVSFNDYHCGISQITVLNMDYIKAEKPGVIDYMVSACEKDRFDLLALMVTELSTRSTELWVTGPLSDEVKKELNGRPDLQYVTFDRLMSRKKDIIPLIDSAIEKINL